jgi:hypothetical protein
MELEAIALYGVIMVGSESDHLPLVLTLSAKKCDSNLQIPAVTMTSLFFTLSH